MLAAFNIPCAILGPGIAHRKFEFHQHLLSGINLTKCKYIDRSFVGFYSRNGARFRRRGFKVSISIIINISLKNQYFFCCCIVHHAYTGEDKGGADNFYPLGVVWSAGGPVKIKEGQITSIL